LTRKDAIKILEKEKEGLKKILQMPLDRNPSGTFEALEIAIDSLKTDEMYNLLAEKGADICECWIPCSERLPETGSHVLVFLKDGYIGTDDYFSYGFDDFKDDVIAWMPLPEPYVEKGESL
jgi:hypothetical protein